MPRLPIFVRCQRTARQAPSSPRHLPPHTHSRCCLPACPLASPPALLQVRSVTAASHEAATLQPDDSVLRIDGVDVGNDGSVPFRHGERVDFKWV